MQDAPRRYSIAAIPGDGIGPEVMASCQQVLDEVAQRHGFALRWETFDWSCQRYARTGEMMPADGAEQVADADAIQLGAVGFPGVPDHVSLWGLLIPLRQRLRQYINLRPVRLLKGLSARVVHDGPIDIMVVRENNEGEYSPVGGRVYEGDPGELAIQSAVFTRRGIERVVAYAAALAEERDGRLVSATKSNGIIHSMPFWDQVLTETVTRDHPDVRVRSEHIDALAAKLVLDPGSFDVLVASNLFGDILTDLGAAIVGGIGIAPSGNINPTGEFPSMFEPVHGSAPDIAGQGLANPVGQLWCASMMLDHLGEPAAAADILAAVERVLSQTTIRTRDLGGTAGTQEMTRAVIDALGQP